MKTSFIIVILLYPFIGFCQYQFNNLEENFNLDITIGEESMDSLWQIGEPQKLLFDSANSKPNVIVTDTIDNYSINSVSSFTLELSEETLYRFPLIQLEWFQKTDMETGRDGGVIEASYDSGSTWLNVFSDTTYRPEFVGYFNVDTLHNGQVGITGSADWAWVAICWGSYTGIEPSIDTSLLIRYTFYSDSVETNQEGWMLDDFYARVGVIGNTSDESNSKRISVYPNPSENSFYINENFIESGDAKLKIYNVSGSCIYSREMNAIDLNEYEINLDESVPGIYYLQIEIDDRFYYQKLIKGS